MSRLDEARRVADEILRYDDGNTDKKTLIVRAILMWVNENVSLIAHDQEISHYRIENQGHHVVNDTWERMIYGVAQQAVSEGVMVKRRYEAQHKHSVERFECDMFVVDPGAIEWSRSDKESIEKESIEDVKSESEFPELPDEVFE